MHDLLCQEARNYGSIVCGGSCRTSVINSSGAGELKVSGRSALCKRVEVLDAPFVLGPDIGYRAHHKPYIFWGICV